MSRIERKTVWDSPAPGPSPRLARMTRHLFARFQDLGENGPVVRMDQDLGLGTARFPGREAQQLLKDLEGFGIRAVLVEEQFQFWMDPEGRFEDLDFLWGCLFQLM